VRIRLSQGLMWCSVLAAATTGLAAGDVASTGAPTPTYSYATNGTVETHPRKQTWKFLLDSSNLGGNELQMAELTLPAGTSVPAHTHHSLEVIYVLAGTYGHEVNGHYYLLQPGMVGIVRPGDHVRHIVPAGAEARLLIVWAPGGEVPVDPSKGTPLKPLQEVPH
jgi:quercetin dioxygenase-like cupin family protein